MRRVLIQLVVVPVLLLSGIAAQRSDTDAVVLLPGLGSLHHPITTSDTEAQAFFDQGLRLFFGFHYDDAVRAFKRAATLDPQAAMPHWGVALALGPNVNNRNPSNDRSQQADAALAARGASDRR